METVLGVGGEARALPYGVHGSESLAHEPAWPRFVSLMDRKWQCSILVVVVRPLGEGVGGFTGFDAGIDAVNCQALKGWYIHRNGLSQPQGRLLEAMLD